MKSHRDGKLTLRTYKVAVAALPKVDSKLIRDTRKRLRCSRAVFARRLRINERTKEPWKNGNIADELRKNLIRDLSATVQELREMNCMLNRGMTKW